MNRGFSGPVCGLAMLLALGTGAAWGQSVVGEPTNAAKTWASNCSMCHRSPQGLAKDERSLSGFLLQHYTTGPQMSAAMAAYLAAAGRGAPARDGGPRERGQREATRDAGRDAAREPAPREAREPRPPREVRAAQPEEGAEKGAPKRTEPRKQQAKATPEEPKRRHHDAAPAVELLPAEASKPETKPETKPASETVRLADPPKPEASKPDASKPEASKPDASKPESPRQEAAASTTASTPDAQAAAAQAAPAQAAAAPAPKLPDNQPSFSSALP